MYCGVESKFLVSSKKELLTLKVCPKYWEGWLHEAFPKNLGSVAPWCCCCRHGVHMELLRSRTVRRVALGRPAASTTAAATAPSSVASTSAPATAATTRATTAFGLRVVPATRQWFKRRVQVRGWPGHDGLGTEQG